MIVVHRLSGNAVVVNAVLLETVGANPDTVITLVDGKRLMVRETPAEVADAVVRHRAAVLAAAGEVAGSLAKVVFFPGDDA